MSAIRGPRNLRNCRTWALMAHETNLRISRLHGDGNPQNTLRILFGWNRAPDSDDLVTGIDLRGPGASAATALFTGISSTAGIRTKEVGSGMSSGITLPKVTRFGVGIDTHGAGSTAAAALFA